MASFSHNYRFNVQCGLVWCLAVLIAAMTAASFAQSDEETAKRAKIESFIQIAREQVRRGYYQQAKQELDQTAASEFAPFVTDQQQQEIRSLLEAIQQAERQRQRIADLLQQSDTLKEQGRYAQAAVLLRQIEDSPYISEQEKNLIAVSLKELDERLESRQGQMQSVYDAAVRDYRAGRLDAARAAFLEVAESGVSVSGDRPAGDYIAAIDQQLKTPTAAQTPETAVQPAAEPEIAPVAQEAVEKTAAVETEDAETKAESSYLQVIRREREVRIDYTTAIVNDTLSRCGALRRENRFEDARQILRRAVSTVERNKLLLGDTLYSEYMAKLNNEEQTIGEQQRAWQQQQEKQREEEAAQLTQQIRETIDHQRAEAIEDYLDRAFAFQAEQRYEEALGQLEQLLAIDPQHQRALIMKQTLEDWTRYREQRRIQQEIEREEHELLLEANRKMIPFSKEINYPRNWKDIAARREKAIQETMSPEDILVNQQLDERINLTMLREDTTLADAINILRNSVDPPLTIVVLWSDLSQNAFIERDTPINMSGEGLIAIVLRTALNRVLQAVSSAALADLDWVLEDGVITIATRDSLPTRYVTEVYDVSDLLNPPANFDEDYSGMMGGMGGGMTGGMGGMTGGMGMMGGGIGGGMMGGGMMGGMGGGMTGGMGMMGGGMMGGMGGGMMGGSTDGVGNWRSMYRAYQVIWTIQQTIEPESWWEEGGDGRIDQFGESKLIIWQTPEVHQKIKEFLEYLRMDLGQQVAIETRFLLVDENFLEHIGLDISRITIEKPGGRWNEGLPLDVRQDSARHVSEQIFSTGTNISSTLGGVLGSSGVGGGAAFSIDSVLALDDLTVDFMIRATQAHRNSRQLTAPKIVVLNGESATMNVQTQKRIKSDSQLVTDTTTTEGVVNTYAYWEVDHEDITTGIQMSITPTITADKKYVLLRIVTYLSELLDTTPVTTVGITPFSDEPLTDTYELPLTQTSSIMTRVSVPDRGTVMLGGLTLTAEREMESGVPVLGKLPVLGRLFSNRSQIKDKQILLVLVKPTIMLPHETEEDAVGALSRP
ncbi:MAG TPA: hypothetical protein ENN97_09290 [Phycisphaerales bacterium]|nr:hypothetical protein [Phycisphaerales bacterium]